MSYAKEYNPTITDQLDDLIGIADRNLDECLGDIFLLRDNKEEFHKKHFPFGLGFQFVFNNDKTKDDRYIILLLDRIDEVLNKLYHIHFFIEINGEHIEWTEELDTSWNTLDNLKRRDLLSCKYGLQRILLNDDTIDKSNEKYWERYIKWDASVMPESWGGEKYVSPWKSPASNEGNITLESNFPQEQNEVENIELPTRRPVGRPSGGTRKIFDIKDEDLAKIFYILSISKIIPGEGSKTEISHIYSRITGHGRDNAKKQMNFSAITASTQKKIIERLKDAITYFEDWSEIKSENPN